MLKFAFGLLIAIIFKGTVAQVEFIEEFRSSDEELSYVNYKRNMFGSVLVKGMFQNGSLIFDLDFYNDDNQKICSKGMVVKGDKAMSIEFDFVDDSTAFLVFGQDKNVHFKRFDLSGKFDLEGVIELDTTLGIENQVHHFAKDRIYISSSKNRHSGNDIFKQHDALYYYEITDPKKQREIKIDPCYLIAVNDDAIQSAEAKVEFVNDHWELELTIKDLLKGRKEVKKFEFQAQNKGLLKPKLKTYDDGSKILYGALSKDGYSKTGYFYSVYKDGVWSTMKTDLLVNSDHYILARMSEKQALKTIDKRVKKESKGKDFNFGFSSTNVKMELVGDDVWANFGWRSTFLNSRDYWTIMTEDGKIGEIFTGHERQKSFVNSYPVYSEETGIILLSFERTFGEYYDQSSIKDSIVLYEGKELKEISLINNEELQSGGFIGFSRSKFSNWNYIWRIKTKYAEEIQQSRAIRGYEIKVFTIF